jgi:hypothetical protein
VNIGPYTIITRVQRTAVKVVTNIVKKATYFCPSLQSVAGVQLLGK